MRYCGFWLCRTKAGLVVTVVTGAPESVTQTFEPPPVSPTEFEQSSRYCGGQVRQCLEMGRPVGRAAKAEERYSRICGEYGI